MTKRLFILLINLLVVHISVAQSPDFAWATSAGSGLADDTGNDICSDGSGNVIATGNYGGASINFGTTTLTNPNPNATNIFLVKYDPLGNVIWAQTTGSTTNMFAEKVCSDANDNIILTGTFTSTTISFGPFTLTNSNSSGGKEIFIVKFDPNGNVLWANSCSGSDNEFPRDVATDANGNVFLIGEFRGATFTVGGTILTNIGMLGTTDVFIAKYDAGGNVMWVRSGGGVDYNVGVTGLCTDNNGNSYVAGNFTSQTCVFGSTTLVNSSTPGNLYQDAFLLKYDDSGNLIWANSTTGIEEEVVFDVASDNNGSIVITGVYTGSSISFGSTSNPTSITSGGISNDFLVKYDETGSIQWAKSFGGASNTYSASLGMDPDGNIILGGRFAFSNVSIETIPLVSNGVDDIFIAQFDNSGFVQWVRQIGGVNQEYINGLNVNSNGSILITGHFASSTLSFGTVSVTSSNTFGMGRDIYIAKMDPSSIVWTGNNSSSWTSPFNWEPQQVPTVSDNVNIPAGRPFDPIIKSGEVANCKKLTIANGAVFRMNAGMIHVYGKITATSASAFQLNGGGMHLYHGSEFPENMTFNNLTIKNETDVDADNQYKFNGFTAVNGNFKVFGTVTKPALPKIILEEGDDIHVFKNFVLSAGTLGWPYINSIPTDRSQLPGLFFYGTGVQNITISNQTSVQNSSAVDCNIYMANPSAKFTLPNRELSFFNLIVNDNFNLAGKRLSIIGKIVYANGIGSTFKITNSNPSRGSISIFNDALLVYDNDDQYIRIDKVRALRCNLTTPVTNTILLTAFAADTLEVKGYLDLNGQNLTIGSTSTNLGTLDVESLGTSITQGTLFLYGNAVNPPYQLVALALNNLVLNNPNGVVLNNAINIPSTSPNWSQMLLYGTAKLTAGSFDLNGSLVSLVKNTLTNSPNVAKIVETPFNTFLNFGGTGAGPALRIDTNVTTAITNKNYGGLGFVIQSNVPLNQLSIVRSPVEQTGINGGSSIFRTYTIYNQGSTPGMNAFVSIEYDDIESGSTTENDLAIYRRSSDEPAGVWNPVSSIVFPSTNIVTSFGTSLTSLDYSTSVGGFTQYTLASTSNPPRIANESLSNSMKVNVYPNPFTSELSAQLTSEISESASLQIIDIAGKLIEEKSVQLNKGNNNINLCCMNELPGGVYFLKITSSQTNSIVKIVKQ